VSFARGLAETGEAHLVVARVPASVEGRLLGRALPRGRSVKPEL
jgi:hypothetical protein